MIVLKTEDEMSVSGTRSVLSVLAAALVLAVWACGGGGEAPASSDDAIPVVATTSIVADLVSEVGGERVAVEGLMGPGVDPHLYKPSAGDVRRMSSARAVFYSGLHLEGKMTEVLAELGGRGIKTTAVAECVAPEQLIQTNEAGTLHDPHIWFDVALWQQAARCAGAALAELAPAYGPEFEARTDAYVGELEKLDAWVRAELGSVPAERRILVTAHDAFSYFGRAYGMQVRGLLGVSTASEAGTADVTALAQFIVANQVPAVFVESSVSPRFVQSLQAAVRAEGAEVAIGGELYSDALGNPDSPAGSYIGTVRANVSTIVTALGGGGGVKE